MAVFKQAEVLLMLAFVAALVLYFTLKLWLNMRQIRFIMAHQHQVPPPFDCHIDLEAHQKSARYAFVKLRLARLGLFISTSVLLIKPLLEAIPVPCSPTGMAVMPFSATSAPLVSTVRF